jgi:glycosyltransferase involved in cell wall biosynthesis
MIIVSNNAKQGNIYERAYAAHLAGLDCRLVTGGYYKPGTFPYNLVPLLPGGKRRPIESWLKKRHHDGLPDSKVIQISAFAVEPMRFLRMSYDLIDSTHDRLVARWLRREAKPADIFHGFQHNCLHSLRAAKRKSIKTLIEVTHPPLERRHWQVEVPGFGVVKNDFSKMEDHFASELAAADHIMAQSAYTIEYLKRMAFGGLSRVFELTFGIDVARFAPAPRGSIEDKSKRVRILMVGQVGFRKATWHLLDEVKKLKLPNVEIQIVGPVVDRVGEHCLQTKGSNVTYLGRVGDTELTRLYQQASLFVMPSLTEGACSAVMEAQAAGLPCVVSDAAVSIVRDGITGIVVPRLDGERLRQAISTLCEDHDLRTRMSESARKLALDYDWAMFYPRMAAFYRLLGAN